MTKYAQQTAVPVDRSRAEIEHILMRYGATAFAYASESRRAMISFKASDRLLRFVLNLPDPEVYRHTPGRGRARNDGDMLRHWEQACRSSWRSLALLIKAKLEAVESGIKIFDDEFLSHIVMPNGKTAGELLVPQIEQAYMDRKMPNLLAQFCGSGE